MWQAGQFYKAGFEGATYGHKILKISNNEDEELELSSKEILQQLLNGLFEPNKLPDPTTVVPCFDDASAKSTVDFIGKILHDLAATIPPIEKIKDEVQKFGDSLPQAVKDCLSG